MPRLTNQSYLSQRHQLRDICADNARNAFPLLSASAQWSLYAYYLPQEQLSDQQLLEHRVDITALDPSLPQRAGRAFPRLKLLGERLPAFREASSTAPKRAKGSATELHVFGEVKPDLDAERMAQILIAIYRERENQDKAA